MLHTVFFDSLSSNSIQKIPKTAPSEMDTRIFFFPHDLSFTKFSIRTYSYYCTFAIVNSWYYNSFIRNYIRKLCFENHKLLTGWWSVFGRGLLTSWWSVFRRGLLTGWWSVFGKGLLTGWWSVFGRGYLLADEVSLGGGYLLADEVSLGGGGGGFSSSSGASVFFHFFDTSSHTI